MDIIHRFASRFTPQQRAQLRSWGIEIGVPKGEVGVFKIAESSPHFGEVSAWARREEVSVLVDTRFTDEEVRAADWLHVVPKRVYGYPLPLKDIGYSHWTYDRQRMCLECRVGCVQVAPFRVRSAPKWRRNLAIGMNWVPDEMFFRPELFAAVGASFGLRSRPVADAGGLSHESILQVDIAEVVATDTSGLRSSTCAACGMERFEVNHRGYMGPLKSRPAGHVAKTEGWYGSGGSSFRLILMSQELFAAIQEHHPGDFFVTPVSPA